MVSPSITEATPATSARAGLASRQRAMVSARMATACHGWDKKEAPLRRTFQPQCPLPCELGLLNLQLRTWEAPPANVSS